MEEENETEEEEEEESDPMTDSEKPGIAIMTSGGDSAGMNPAVKCAAEYAAQRGYAPFLIYDGLRGLVADRIHPATHERLSGMMHKGGTVLRSSRSPEFYDIEVRRKAYENLRTIFSFSSQ